MRFSEIQEANSTYIRDDFWYQPSTNTTLISKAMNHAEMVAKCPSKFGISREEIQALRENPDFEYDWNEPAIKMANRHGWVRVKLEGYQQSLEMSAQSTDRKALHKAVKHFMTIYSPVNLYLDNEVNSYDTIWHTKLTGRSMETYVKTGRIPRINVT